MSSVFSGYTVFFSYSREVPLEKDRHYTLMYRWDEVNHRLHVIRDCEGTVTRYRPFFSSQNYWTSLWDFLILYFKAHRKKDELWYTEGGTDITDADIGCLMRLTEPSPYREYFADSVRIKEHPAAAFGKRTVDQLALRLEQMTVADWAPLFALMPNLRSLNPLTGLLVLPGDDESSVYKAPEVTANDMVVQLASGCDELGVAAAFDWTAWSDGFALLDDPYTDYERLSTDVLCKLLSAVLQRDVYADGFAAAMIERGTVLRIVEAIKSSVESTEKHRNALGVLTLAHQVNDDEARPD